MGVKRGILCVALATGMFACSEKPLRAPQSEPTRPVTSAVGAEVVLRAAEPAPAPPPTMPVVSAETVEAPAPMLAVEPLPRGPSFRRGIVMGPFGAVDKPEPFRRTYGKLLDQAAAIGATDLQIVVRWSQVDASAVELAPLDTVGDELLQWLIDAAHRRKLRVMLTPTVGIENVDDDDVGRALSPRDWSRWWWSYSRLVLHCARVGVMRKVATIAVGHGLTNTEQQSEPWRKLIGDARRIFKGEIAYVASAESFDRVDFWSDVDVVGIAVDPGDADDGLLAPTASRIAESSIARDRGYVILETSREQVTSPSSHRALLDSFGDAARLRGLFVQDALEAPGRGRKKHAATEVVRKWFAKNET